ncbi:MAG: hypothetical protein ABH803_04370 [Candidatus Micrarchaeota archaeon]
MSRGQISVEFFLVLSIMIAFILIIYSTVQGEITKQRDLNSIVLAQSALDSVSYLTNFVYLSGPGTSLSKEIFIPSSTVETPSKASANCFFIPRDSDGNPDVSYVYQALYCTVLSDYVYEVTDPDYIDETRNGPLPGKQRVFGPELEFTIDLFSFSDSCKAPLGYEFTDITGNVVKLQAQPGWYSIKATYLMTGCSSGVNPCIELTCKKIDTNQGNAVITP